MARCRSAYCADMLCFVILATLVFGCHLSLLVVGSGFLEVVFIRFNDTDGYLSDGFCCGVNGSKSPTCPGTCIIRPRLCLQQYNAVPSARNQDCIFGNAESEQHLENVWEPEDEEDETRKMFVWFSFQWPGAATLVIDLLHVSGWRPSYDADVARPSQPPETIVLRLIHPFEQSAGDPKQFIDQHFRFGQSGRPVRFVASLQVRCEPNYFGPNCSQFCRADGAHGNYRCSAKGEKICLFGWTGLDCLKPVCGRGCKHGTCIAPDTCLCDPGWEGDDCSTCQKYLGCKHGFCVRPYECQCYPRYGGQLCDKDLDYCYHKNPCRNGATCYPTDPNNYTCYCANGFAGRDCEIMTSHCRAVQCYNFGTCVETDRGHQCNCPQGFTGSLCEISLNPDNDDADRSSEGVAQSSRRLDRHRVCFDPRTNQQYAHDAQWHTLQCERCACANGFSACTQPRCATANCLSNEGGLSPVSVCPAAQGCKSIWRSTCLKESCAQSYGECRPWQLFERMRFVLGCRGQPLNCAAFLVVLDTERLPTGTTVEKVCFHMELTLWARNISSVVLECSLVSPRFHQYVDIDVLAAPSDQSYPIHEITAFLVDILNANVSQSPILYAIVQASRTLPDEPDSSRPNNSLSLSAHAGSSFSDATYFFVLVIVLACVVGPCVWWRAKVVLFLRRIFRTKPQEEEALPPLTKIMNPLNNSRQDGGALKYGSKKDSNYSNQNYEAKLGSLLPDVILQSGSVEYFLKESAKTNSNLLNDVL